MILALSIEENVVSKNQGTLNIDKERGVRNNLNVLNGHEILKDDAETWQGGREWAQFLTC